MTSAFDLFLASRDTDLPADKALEAAWNAAIEAAAGICQAQVVSVGQANPGRGKGSVSHVGLFGQGILETCEQRIKALARCADFRPGLARTLRHSIESGVTQLRYGAVN